MTCFASQIATQLKDFVTTYSNRKMICSMFISSSEELLIVSLD